MKYLKKLLISALLTLATILTPTQRPLPTWSLPTDF